MDKIEESVKKRRLIMEFSEDKDLYLCTIGLKMQRPEDCSFINHHLEATDDTVADLAMTHGCHIYHRQVQVGGEIIIWGILKLTEDGHKEIIVNLVDNNHIEGVPL